MANTGAGDLTAGELGGSFRRHAKLELVDVSGNRVTAAGVEALRAAAARRQRRWRRRRRVGRARVLEPVRRRRGAARGGAGLASPTGALAALDLSYNQLGDAAGVALARSVAANSTLKILGASRNRLGAFAAGEFAAAVAGCRKLQVLKLGWNPLGTEGALEAVFNYENDFNLVDRMFAETAKRVKLDKARRAKQAESAIVKSDRSSQARKGFKKRGRDPFHRNASAIMKRGDHLQVLDGLQSFNRRKDESSYFEQDQADLNFRTTGRRSRSAMLF
ncbi:hypothetical protein JL721_10039 [Aureococcus anophagefferens]|nr:hypothetical protein JL721_10039 [Aureococcus anophagefferens]